MKRLDNELITRKLFKTRSKAQQAIKNGNVYCDNKKVTKCGYEVNESTVIEIKGEILNYVSRGGLKLEKAIKTWNINLEDKIMIDIGSSTGGFSDCAIQNGIKKIYAVDVGSEQFDKELAKNPKIYLYEKTDFRNMDENVIGEANIITIDVSFISVTKMLEKISNLKNVKEIVCLIKPQFEAGKEIADKFKGVINDKAVHEDVILKVIESFKTINFECVGLTYSPIKGGDGNIEYLAYFKCLVNGKEKINIDEIKKVVFETNKL